MVFETDHIGQHFVIGHLGCHHGAPIFCCVESLTGQATKVERLFVVMEMPDSCLLARINMILMMVVIIGNLTVLVLASLPADQCHHIIIDLEAANPRVHAATQYVTFPKC
eukprot:6481446-Amphidinium_carterae.2